MSSPRVPPFYPHPYQRTIPNLPPCLPGLASSNTSPFPELIEEYFTRMLTNVSYLVYHPLINNGESTTTFMVPWGEYLGTLTGAISDVEEEVEKAVKKLTTTDRKTSANQSGGVRIESLMRPLG